MAPPPQTARTVRAHLLPASPDDVRRNLNKWGPDSARTSNGLAHNTAPAGRDEDEEAEKMGVGQGRTSPNFETVFVAHSVDLPAFLTSLIFTGLFCFLDFYLKELRWNSQQIKSWWKVWNSRTSMEETLSGCLLYKLLFSLTVVHFSAFNWPWDQD